MKSILVARNKPPKKGEYIETGHCEYFKSDNGLPSIRYKATSFWSFSSAERVFIFATDALQVGTLNDKDAKSEARLSGFDRSNSGAMWGAAGGGIVGSLVASVVGSLVTGAFGAATAKTSGIKGFWVEYKNSVGLNVGFIVVAEPQIVEEILNSIPTGKISSDPNKKL